MAEDNAEIRHVIAEILRGEYRVELVADGVEALTRAIAVPPDLVITDLMMPKVGGDRLVADMRLRQTLTHVPVLVLSAQGDDALRIKLLAGTGLPH